MKHRNLRLSRSILKVVSEFFQLDPSLNDVCIQDAEFVNNATVHIIYRPMADGISPEDIESMHARLHRITPKVRKTIADETQMKYTPNVHFKIDSLYLLEDLL